MEKIKKISLIAIPIVLILLAYNWYEKKQYAQYNNIAYLSEGIDRSM